METAATINFGNVVAGLPEKLLGNPVMTDEPAPNEDARLVARTQAGDPAAFDVLVVK